MLKTGVISVRCVRVATQPLPESLAKNVLPDIVRRCPVIANRHNRAGVFGYLGMFSSPCVANNVSPAYDQRLEVLRPQYLGCTISGCGIKDAAVPDPRTW
jgi:hypothetical protein